MRERLEVKLGVFWKFIAMRSGLGHPGELRVESEAKLVTFHSLFPFCFS